MEPSRWPQGLGVGQECGSEPAISWEKCPDVSRCWCRAVGGEEWE